MGRARRARRMACGRPAVGYRSWRSTERRRRRAGAGCRDGRLLRRGLGCQGRTVHLVHARDPPMVGRKRPRRADPRAGRRDRPTANRTGTPRPVGDPGRRDPSSAWSPVRGDSRCEFSGDCGAAHRAGGCGGRISRGHRALRTKQAADGVTPDCSRACSATKQPTTAFLRRPSRGARALSLVEGECD